MNESLSKLLRPSILIPVVVGIVSFGTGTGVGYLLGRRKKMEIHETPKPLHLDLDVSDLTESQVDEITEIFDPKTLEYREEVVIEGRGEEIATPEELFILQHLPGTVVMAEEPTEEHHIFAASSGEWNYEEELRHRTDKAPYVLHRDEFYAEEMDYAQSTMTYYAGDDIMVDQDDAPVYNYPAVVGPLLFGHGSDDPKVFHVRNDVRKAEYEIIHDSGFYGVEVLGLELEEIQEDKMDKDLKHQGPPKMRPE